MRPLLLAAAALAALAGCASITPPAANPHHAAPAITRTIPTPPAAAAAVRQPRCDAALWQHIYHPARLQVIRQCMAVTGTVQSVRREPDGDLHFDLDVPAALIDAANDQQQHGWLVVEAICTGRVTQADAVAACAGVTTRVPVPAVGERVRVTGSYVLDKDHGWMEIHPVSSLVVLP